VVVDVVLFGATGYTGRLTARALGRRNASFAVAGRDPGRLEAVAEATGAVDVRTASVGDPSQLSRCLRDARVLLSCVGPFVALGDTGVDAALAAGVHYVDSTGEGAFVRRLLDTRDKRARAAGVKLAPAMAFDEVPADVACTKAVSDRGASDVTLTYALPSRASPGTVRASAEILAAPGTWLEDGGRRPVSTGDRSRWAPMPPPLGVRRSVSAHLAESHLAPLHLDVRSVRTYVTVGTITGRLLRAGLPALRVARRAPPVRRALEDVLAARVPRPDEAGNRPSRWTILAEANGGDRRCNVALAGANPYRLSAELLSAAALHLATEDRGGCGVKAPVQAVGLETLHRELVAHGVDIHTY
jgi:short subunit dehydrogenase-like uncharacterized protein